MSNTVSGKSIAVGALLGVALALGLWLALQRAAPPALPAVATILPTPVELPEFSLVDHKGEPIDRSFFQGQWDLVFFGFTHCPDICPLTLQTLSNAKQQLREAGHTPLPRIVLVSLDPERDTPEKLAQYIKHFGADNAGVTGELGALRTLTGKLGVYFEKREEDGDFYTVDHSSNVFVFDAEGRYRALFSSPHKAKNFVHDLPLLTGS